MATTIVNFNHQFNFNTIDTFNYTIVNTGTKRISVSLNAIRGATDGITITVKQNGTTELTVTGSTAGAGMTGNVLLNCTAADTIAFVVASTTAADAGPNQFKGFFGIDGNV